MASQIIHPITKRAFIKTALTGACAASLPFVTPLCFAQDVHEVRVSNRGDTNSNYSIGLLKLALKKSGKPFKLSIVEKDLAPLRQRKELLEGSMDVIWNGTNTDLEENALPIRVPIYKGLLGHRILIVHRDNQHMFDGVKTWDDMLAHTYGQGKSWPDSDIMRANGMTVVPAVKYDSLFYMADGKRFDAFPRGAHEPWSELEAHPDLALTVDKNVVLVYRMPYYLFVNPAKKQLAEDIYTGMMKAVVDGSFDEYFYSNPTVKSVIEKVGLKDRKLFSLTNPALSPLTPLNDARLWVDVAKL